MFTVESARKLLTTAGAYALNSASFAFNAALDFTTTQKAATLARVTLVDTTTTNTDMLTQANVRSAVGLASANLDTQLTTIDDYLDTEVAAIKAKTDNLPVSPAATGDIAAAIVTYGLDHLVYTSVVGTDVADNSIIAKLASKSATADWDTFNNTTESHEALRDNYTTGGDTILVSPLLSTLRGNDIVSSGTTQAFRYTPLPSGPIVVIDADDDPINLSAAAVKMISVNTTVPSDTWTLTEATGLSVGGASNNEVSVDYLPTFCGKYKWWLDYQPSGETDWTLGGFGFFDIGDAPDPR